MRLKEVLITRVSVLAAGGEDWRSLTSSIYFHHLPLESQVLWVGGPTRNQQIGTTAGLLEWRLEDPPAS